MAKSFREHSIKAGLPEDLVLYCGRHNSSTRILKRTANISASRLRDRARCARQDTAVEKRAYSLDVGFEPELMPRPYVLECENCGWQKQQEEA